MKNLYVGAFCFIIFGFMGCTEKSENVIHNNIEVSKLEQALINLAQNYPGINIEVDKNIALESRTQDCEPDDQSGCTDVFISNLPIDVNGCSVIVSFWAKLCFGLNNITLVGMWDFNFAWTSDPDCKSVRLQWSYLYSQGRTGELETAMNNFYREASRATEKAFVVSVFLAPIDCISQGAHNVAHFYEMDCQSLCVEQINLDGDVIFNFSRIICGEACCRRITPWCMHNGEWINPGPPEVLPVGEPECDPVSVLCNGLPVQNASCMHPCDRI